MDARSTTQEQSREEQRPPEIATQHTSTQVHSARPESTETTPKTSSIQPKESAEGPTAMEVESPSTNITTEQAQPQKTDASQMQENDDEPDSESDDESSSSSFSSSSSDDEEEEEEEAEGMVGVSKMEQETQLEKMISQAAEVGLEDKFGPRTQNEVVRTEVAVSPLPKVVGVNERVSMAGKVLSVQAPLNSLVLRAVPDSETGVMRTLDHDSLICTESKQLVGRIEEVFGPVVSPFYVVRLMGDYSVAKDKTDSDSGDSVTAAATLPTAGDELYVVDKFKKVVDPAQLSTVGSDASNLYNEEPDPEEVEYSDDEAEALARKQKRGQRQADKNGSQQATQRRFARPHARSGGDRRRHNVGQRPIQPVNWATSPPPPLPPVPQHVQNMQRSFMPPQVQNYPQSYAPSMTPSAQSFAPPYNTQPFPSQTGVYFNQHAPVSYPQQPGGQSPLYVGHSSYQEAATHARGSATTARPMPPQKEQGNTSTRDTNGLKPPGLD